MDPPAVAGSSRQSSSSSSEIVQIDVETETAAVVDAEAVECAVDPAAVVGVAPPLTEEEIRSDAWAFLKFLCWLRRGRTTSRHTSAFCASQK
jgi:hypothetical protein